MHDLDYLFLWFVENVNCHFDHQFVMFVADE